MLEQSGKRAAARRSLRFGLSLLPILKSRAEDRVDYRYEDYQEDGGRIHIETHGFLFDKGLASWLSLKGSVIYDGISGATPTGVPPLPGESTVAKATIEDIRRAGFIEPSFKFLNHTLSPQLAYSKEKDYESIGVSLTDSFDLNQKNTTITWGGSHAFDRIIPNIGEAITESQKKDATDLLVGVSQLFGPTTVFRANLTLGYSDGYLDDPYKRVLFTDFPYFPGFDYTGLPEKRPSHKFRQVALFSIQQFVTPLNGALEASYRFHHDDWGIAAHTLTAEWHQKVGKWLTISPLFRYYTQTRADFYATKFPGDPTIPSDDPSFVPLTVTYYSSDYRLSDLDSYTMGLTASIHVHEHVSLEFGYKRYLMYGTDHVTVADQYPKAHIFTGGLTLWF
jgi:hypothetical protein